MLLFDSPKHLRNCFSRKQRFLGLGCFVFFFFLSCCCWFFSSLFYGNESPFPEFPLGREAARCSLTSISLAPCPHVAFNAPTCSELPFAEEPQLRGSWSELSAPLLHGPQLKLPGQCCAMGFTTHTCSAVGLLLASPMPGFALPFAAGTCPGRLLTPWAVPHGHTAALRWSPLGWPTGDSCWDATPGL